MSANTLTMERCDVEHKGERLVHIRLAVAETTAEERAAFAPKMKGIVTRIVGTGRRFVVAADLRGPQIVSPETTAFILEIMKADNPALERSGILISQSATLGMQVDRLMSASGSNNRKRFYEPAPMEKWLGEILKPEEQQHLATFLKKYKGQ